MSISPTIQLAETVSNIDKLQMGIADLERRMDESLMGSVAESQTALRLELTKLKAALGEARNQEAFWKDQIASDSQDRKGMGELGKG